MRLSFEGNPNGDPKADRVIMVDEAMVSKKWIKPKVRCGKKRRGGNEAKGQDPEQPGREGKQRSVRAGTRKTGKVCRISSSVSRTLCPSSSLSKLLSDPASRYVRKIDRDIVADPEKASSDALARASRFKTDRRIHFSVL